MVYVGLARKGHGTRKLDLKTLNTRLKDFLLYRLEVSLAKLYWQREIIFHVLGRLVQSAVEWKKIGIKKSIKEQLL